MTAFNIVRFRVKAGRAEHFIAAHQMAKPKFEGFRGGALVRTGDQTFCVIGEWKNFQSLAGARAEMIALLDTFREDLEDLGNGLGVTDPVSGDLGVKLAASKSPRKKAKKTATRRKRR